MPFQALDRPNLGLSLLKATLERAGFACDLLYGNLRMAEKIGLDAYLVVAGLLPQELLFGDFLFAPLVREAAVREAAAREAAVRDAAVRDVATSGGSTGLDRLKARIPPWLWAKRFEIRREARHQISEMARKIVAEGWDLVGFNLMFQVMPSLALACEIKRLRPQTRVILGGANCEGTMGRVLHDSFPWIDFVCRGEGEGLLVELVRHLETGTPELAAIDGLLWRNGSVTVANGERAPRTANLDTLATPNYGDWLAQMAESSLALDPHQLRLPIETSRGCWWGQRQHCIFCGLNGESLTFGHKSPERARQEILELRKAGIPRIYAVDLIFPHTYFTSLLPHLAEDDLGLELFYEIKANLSKEHLVLLARAGVKELQPGIESLSTQILKSLRKGVSAYQNVRLLKWAAELGLRLTWNLLVGFPGDSAEDYARMTAMIPALTHMQPPTIGCCPVRIDRFSPLFVEAETFGLTGLEPAEAYGLVYDLPREILARLAYHFESNREPAPEVAAEIRALQAEVQRWQTAAGTAVFLVWFLGDSARLLDRRPGAKIAEANLEGLEHRLFEACGEGATLPRLSEIVRCPPAELEPILDRWVDNRWVVSIDDRYLSLALDLESLVPNAPNLPAALAEALAVGLHGERMRALRQEVEDQIALLKGETWATRAVDRAVAP